MSLRGRQLLQDVHRLACLYHWGEAEILSLPLPRRRAYLSLIEAEQDRELLRGLEQGV